VGKLTYSMSVSLDGYIAGPDGRFDWSVPSQELHRFHNERTRELGCHLLGRHLYETMVYWETADQDPELGEVEREFAASGRSFQRPSSQRRSRRSRATRGWCGTVSSKRSSA
jgi:dihydrofolate reductase